MTGFGLLDGASVADSLASLDEDARVRLGAGRHTPPSLLQSLAGDASVMVRVALAMNPATPTNADQTLARDPDERVRVLLARKLTGLVGGLSNHEQERIQREAFEMLTTLAADEAVRVRATISDILKEMPTAPRELILRLAGDAAQSVCEPVIRFSPLLTTEDLLALVRSPASSATILAVARHPQVTEEIADAIAGGGDSAAIRELLSNRMSQIREATLDALIARAAEQIEWHEPLVHRPILPPRSARALSEIVADHLLDKLANRPDFDPAIAAELRQRLAERLKVVSEARPAGGDVTIEQAEAEAELLARSRMLNEESVLRALQSGQARLATALLARAADVPRAVVDRAVALRSAKGLVSLTWKAGFSMRLAAMLQSALVALPPAQHLQARIGNSFPLSREEMLWQIGYLRRTAV